MLYHPKPSPTILTIPTPTVSGRNIAHAHRCLLERAFGAADTHRGRLNVVKLTIGQAAPIWGVCRSYVTAAVAVSDDRELRAAILAGEVPLLKTTTKAEANGNGESLAAHIARSTPEELVEAGRTVGAATLWDAMIEPLI